MGGVGVAPADSVGVINTATVAVGSTVGVGAGVTVSVGGGVLVGGAGEGVGVGVLVAGGGGGAVPGKSTLASKPMPPIAEEAANQAVRPSSNPLWPATPPTASRTAAGSILAGRRTWTVASQIGSSG